VGRRPRKHVTDDLVFASMLLDAGAVLAFAQDRPEVRRWLEQAETHGVDPRVALVTIAEVFRDRPAGGRVQWVLSRLDEEPFTVKHAQDAGRLLGATGSGDRTIDAIVAATALRMPRPVAVLTSDPKDLARLLEGQRRVIVAKV
jgi:predicted nucleic acid-binding protein